MILPSFITSVTPLKLLYTLSCTVDFDLSSRGAVSAAEGGTDAGASTSGTFSFTGEAGSVTAVLALAGGSSADEEAGGGALPKLRAISSKVLPFVSGTLMKVKTKKMMRKAVKMRKTQGPHNSWGKKRKCQSQTFGKERFYMFRVLINSQKNKRPLVKRTQRH